MSGDETLYATEPNRVLASGETTLDAIALTFVVRSNGVTVEARTGPVSERSIEIDYADVFAADIVEEVAYGIRIETTDTEYTVTNVTSSRAEAEAVVTAVRDRITGLRSGASMSSAGSTERPTQSANDAAKSISASDGGGAPAPPESGPDAREAGGASANDGVPEPDGRPDAGSTPPSGSRRPGEDGAGDAASGEAEAPDDAGSGEATDEPASSLGFGGDSRRTAQSGETIECPACEHETLVPETIPPEQQDVVCPGCGSVIGETDRNGECVYIEPDVDGDE